MKGLLSTLKQQNRDLRRLQKQSSELRRIRGQISLNTPMPFSEAENSPTPDDGTTAEVFAIRDFAECLYEGLALAADCSCHNVNLRLEGMSFHQNAKDNSASRTTFQLVISPGNYRTSPNDVSDCVCLLVQSERRMEGGGAANVLPASAQSTVGSSWKRKASDYFSSDTTNPKRTNQIVRYNIMMNTSPLSASNNRMPSTSLNITSLCSALKSTGPRSQSRHCLGFIGNKNMSCQHLLYMEPDSYPSSSRLSLSNLLSASGRQHLPPPSERLRMAPILALSILQFGSFSSSWFQEHWRSRDIFFFLNERISNRCGRAAATSASLSLAPYITSFFGLPQLQPSRRIARNNQLFSLALVLSEIAFGMTLPEIPSPNNIPTFAEDDSILEYLKLKEIVDTKRLEGQVSRKYAKVVEQCFYCDFGLGGDFTKKDLQKAFLRNVVGKLQECVRVLDED